jgi:hypothetical protein
VPYIKVTNVAGLPDLDRIKLYCWTMILFLEMPTLLMASAMPALHHSDRVEGERCGVEKKAHAEEILSILGDRYVKFPSSCLL